jgi:tetratricopeptide (TPR) repeat protein
VSKRTPGAGKKAPDVKKKVPDTKAAPEASAKARRWGGRNAILALIGIAVLCAAGFYAWRELRPAAHAPAQADAHGGEGYADPATCVSCHADIAKTYAQTGMGRSFHRVNASDASEGFTAHNTLYNKASDRYYAMVAKDGKLYEQRHQVGFDGKEANLEEKQIDYVIGSGNHSRTYLHRSSDGKLVELPVSWYSEMGGYWEMSPGYDNPNQKDFRRPIGYECMSCHNAYPAADQVSRTSSDENDFGDKLPEGIDCQRCHGPGSAHVQAATKEGTSLDAVRASILNPAKLPRDRQMNVCMQCHLETTSLPLPHSIRRFTRAAFSFRPGEMLQDYETFFDHKPGTGYDDRLEVAHQAYRLRKSACFLNSQMTCTTCHNPHQALRGEEATKHYVAVCSSCHTNVHAKMAPVAGKNCLTCHMWKQRTEDAVHVVMTDHYIQRVKPKKDMLAPVKEMVPAYHDEVVAYDPKTFAQGPDGELYLAVAQVEQESNLQAGTVRLQQAIERDKPEDARFYFTLGAAYAKGGKNAEAIPWFEEALRRRPDYPVALREFAATLAAQGNLTRSAEIGEKAAAAAPADTAVLTNLGNVYLQQGRIDDAKRVLQQALAINPDLPDAKVFMGLVWMNEKNLPQGEASFRSAISSQPDLAEAHNDLASVLANRGDLAEAGFHLQKAIEGNPTNAEVYRNYGRLLALTGSYDKAIAEIRLGMKVDPKSAQLHIDLGNVLAKKGDVSSAKEEYGRAIQLDANNEYGEAHLRLAEILARQGQAAKAHEEYQKAAESPDPRVRQAAMDALR